jgi:protein-tyrosine phosphatase
MDWILDNLAIGNFEESQNPPEGVEALLSVAEEREIIRTEFTSFHVPIVDMQPIPTEQLSEAIQWIHDTIEQNSIMVFCNAGVGRSPSTVVTYLAVYHNMEFGEAVEFVARKKPYMSILPNLILNIDELKRRLT